MKISEIVTEAPAGIESPAVQQKLTQLALPALVAAAEKNNKQISNADIGKTLSSVVQKQLASSNPDAWKTATSQVKSAMVSNLTQALAGKGVTVVQQTRAGDLEVATPPEDIPDPSKLSGVDKGSTVTGQLGKGLSDVLAKAASQAGGETVGITTQNPAGDNVGEPEMDAKLDFVDKSTGKKYFYHRVGNNWFDDKERVIRDPKVLNAIQMHPNYKAVSATTQGALQAARLKDKAAADAKAAANKPAGFAGLNQVQPK